MGTWAPADVFLELGPVDQYKMREELWVMWERLGGEYFTDQGPAPANGERDVIYQIAAAIKIAHDLSRIVSDLRRTAERERQVRDAAGEV
jgi:hypothetical protein